MNTPKKIHVTSAQYECPMCPTIIKGETEDGCTVYARYRWGHLSVRVDSRNPAPHSGAAGASIMERQLDPEGLDGWLDYEELRAITANLIIWPAELTPRTYDETNPATTL